MLSSKHIWIVNPFDQLPNESDIPLRFWSLSKTLSKEGYKVTWWSSDFSHKHKTTRLPCADTDGFSIRLIKTPSYKKNISLNRIISHHVFSKNFYDEAIKELKANNIEKPFRIVISLPPLGVAERAFKLRDYINQAEEKDCGNVRVNSEISCKVIIDIMDAWPEVFYRILPKKIRYYVAPILLFFFHRSAKIAYQRADKISAVGQSYLDIAQDYLYDQNFISKLFIKNDYKNQALDKPTHLCYHGVNLKRFDSKIISKRSAEYNSLHQKIKLSGLGNIKFVHKEKAHLQIVYIGAMNSGYDLKTVIDVAEKWKNEGEILLKIHFAGKGDMLDSLKLRSKKLGLLNPLDSEKQRSQIIFHGYLNNDEINNLLLSSDIALVTNRSETLVACPYKAGEYAGAGLPMISCLDGEFNSLLRLWSAGLTYDPENIQSLFNAINKYSKDFELLKKHNINARNMAEYLFDREKTYKNFSKFIINNV
jgi:glycosyltransferase involved in cell wall biosynthesis